MIERDCLILAEVCALLSALHVINCIDSEIHKNTFSTCIIRYYENACSLVKRCTFEDEPQCQWANMQQPKVL